MTNGPAFVIGTILARLSFEPVVFSGDPDRYFADRDGRP